MVAAEDLAFRSGLVQCATCSFQRRKSALEGIEGEGGGGESTDAIEGWNVAT